MKTKEYYFDLFESHFISANPYWEDPFIHTQLRENTEETLDLLESYLKLLKTKKKSYEKHQKNMDNYDTYSDDVKQIIDNIIKLINDGRDLWHEVEYKNIKKQFLNPDPKPRKYSHHINKNGHLTFENEPWDYINSKLYEINKLREIIESEKVSKQFDLNKFVDNKFYYFEGYENGSASVRFHKINLNNKGRFTFDGDIINYATVDSHFDGDGIVIQSELTDIDFNELPYCDGFNKDNIDDLIKFISNRETIETYNELVKSLHNTLDSYIKGCL